MMYMAIAGMMNSEEEIRQEDLQLKTTHLGCSLNTNEEGSSSSHHFLAPMALELLRS